MKLFKKALAGVAMAAALTAVHAVPTNIGGVILDPDAPSDFSGTSATLYQSINPVTGELTGYGNVTILNNTLQTTFCPGCELTIQYSGFLPGVVNAIPGGGGGGTNIQYTGGTIKLFIDTSPDTNFGINLTDANTKDGDLWLELAGHAIGGFTFTGTNFFPALLQGGGVFDVVGGLAQAYLDTNTQQDGSDIKISTTFTSFVNPGSPLVANGSGTFTGDAVVRVPEPASIALLGLGLVGVGISRRRKSAK